MEKGEISLFSLVIRPLRDSRRIRKNLAVRSVRVTGFDNGGKPSFTSSEGGEWWSPKVQPLIE